MGTGVTLLRAAACAALLGAGGCGGAASTALPAAPANPTGAGKIKHVIYVVQENRCFNDLFQGYPGAYTVPAGKDSKGETIALRRSRSRIST